MKFHLKIWVPGILSLLAYAIAKGLSQEPDPTTRSYSTFWYLVWGALQLIATWFTYQLLKLKHRSGTWIGLVAAFGVLGIIIIYLIPAKKVGDLPNQQALQ